MKKKFVFILLLSVTAIASATTFTFIRKKSKVPIVSENINIPLFIDTLMLHEREIISQIAKDTNSVNARLTKLGFTGKSGNVLDANTAKALETLHEVYDSIYPNHQFINYKCVNELMKKYGLAFGSATAFICDIPSYEIDSMEKFTPSFIFDRNNFYPLHDLITPMGEQAAEHNGYGNIAGYINDTYNRITNGKGALGKERNLIKYSLLDMKIRPLKSTVFFMIAPASCFSGEANTAGNYGNIKDPIVLAPVEGGYIVVTAW